MDAAARNINLKLICIFLYLWALPLVAEDSSDLTEPWSMSEGRPVVEASTLSDKQDNASQGSDYCLAWLAFYQNYLSVISSSKCPMWPSCSNFSIHAIRQYGPLKGIIMTADRLIHEWDEQKYVPMVVRKGQALFFDPVEQNNLSWSLYR